MEIISFAADHRAEQSNEGVYHNDVRQALKGHEGSISSAALSPNTLTILTGSEDKTARLWDVLTGEELLSFNGHTQAITAVAYSPNEKTVLTGSADGLVCLWHSKTGELLKEIKAHTSSITALAFSANSNILLTGSKDRTVKLWNAHTGVLLTLLKGHTYSIASVAYNPRGTTVLTASWDGSIRLWDSKTGEKLKQTITNGIIRTVTFSPNGHTILIAVNDTVQLWDAAMKELLHTFEESAKHTPVNLIPLSNV